VLGAGVACLAAGSQRGLAGRVGFHVDTICSAASWTIPDTALPIGLRHVADLSVDLDRALRAAVDA
jgi:hypothetical protein